jgi:hypothetical protein
MAKTAATIALENWLFDRLNPRGKGRVSAYGATEVTLSVDPSAKKLSYGKKKAGYQGRVDFISIDSSRIVRAYEIKVTLQDFKSKAIKSWVGHYNYLVTPDELVRYKDEILAELPAGIGWVTPTQTVKRPAKRELGIDLDWLVWLMMRRNAMVVREQRLNDN